MQSAQPRDARPAALAGEQERPPDAADAGARVLLIEDEPGIVDFVQRGLEAQGFTVEAALEGVEGERLALEGRFDAVVLDLMLPGRSGLEILCLLYTSPSPRD